MDRIATSQTYSSALLSLMTAQSNAQTAGQQVSTGYQADDLKGYAASADTLTATQAVKSRIDGYLDGNARLADRLTAQDTALNTVADSASSARQAVLSAIATGNGEDLMQTLQGYFAQASDALNTDFQGSFLFSGGKTGTPPVDTGQIADLTTGGAASHFQNGTLKTVDRLDDATTVETGYTASDVGGDFFSALQTIVAQNSSTPFTGTLTNAQISFLQSQLQPLQDAAQGVTDKVAANGVMQNRVDAANSVLTDRQTAATGVIGDLTGVDAAAAATKLQLAQTALSASAKVWQTLSSSSLLDVLQSS